MKDCLVSIAGRDGETHTVEVQVKSLFDAANQAVEQWARLWWYDGDSVVEINDGSRRWQVRLDRVRRWRFGH